jgi:hypothetical protein
MSLAAEWTLARTPLETAIGIKKPGTKGLDAVLDGAEVLATACCKSIKRGHDAHLDRRARGLRGACAEEMRPDRWNAARAGMNTV